MGDGGRGWRERREMVGGSQNTIGDAARDVKTRLQIKINHPLLFPLRS